MVCMFGKALAFVVVNQLRLSTNTFPTSVIARAAEPRLNEQNGFLRDIPY